MAKFIIEIDDAVIREKANPAKALKNSEDAQSILKGMFEFVSVCMIEKQLDKGVNEFVITRELMDDKTKQEFFDRTISDICMLAHFVQDKARNEE